MNARIQAEVYPDAEGRLRWRIRSAARGRRIVADSAQGYTNKADAFRGLLLVTGGEYVEEWRSRSALGGVYTQGRIERATLPWGMAEIIFVEYLSPLTSSS